MHLSRNEFARDTFEFCRALAALVSKTCPKENTAAAPPTLLLQWKLVETNIQGLDVVYLTHPPVTREISQTLDDDDDDDAFQLEEHEQYSLLDDTDTAIMSPQQLLSVWNFSIVYSETWMVPVLYFSVTRNDNGMPFWRNEILEMLDNTDNVEDTWHFVSYQEHPITGEPSCFLHPCQTAQRLEMLHEQQQQQQQQQHGGADSFVGSPIILSWLTMMLPAVGYSIPSRIFSQLQHSLLYHDE
jgi:ubiquitin-like-conjugating enzyme ATG10